jgi:hypothetical protein
MKLEHIFNLADQLVFTKTGKHLDDLQRTILEGTLQGKKYAQIATENQYSDSYIKESASELWQVLSDAIGQEVKKSNFRTTFERLQFYNGFNLINDLVHIGDVNFCTDTPQSNNKPDNLSSLPYIDRDNTPSIQSFYGRTEELQVLEKWITEETYRFIVIAGLNGIGKTYLSLQLINQIKDKFECIIYRSLADFKSLKDLQYDLLESLSQISDNRAKAQLRTDLRVALLEYLRSHSCLIILDDGQSLFRNQRLAGEYQPQHQEYSTFFEMIGKIQHQSCVILNTCETPREVIKLIADNHPTQLLNLTGIGENAAKILKQQALIDDSEWSTLIDLYQGHPLWLKLAGTLIKDVFGGKVSQYLGDQLILPEDLKSLLDKQFERLTETEKNVLEWLSENNTPISVSQLLKNHPISRSESCNAVQSLQRRFLIERTENEETCFTVSPVIKEYCCQINLS